MIRQGGDSGGLDLLAVQRDDELLELLGARRAVSDGDEVARLLAALAADVDDALPAVPLPTDAPATAAGAGTPGHTRRLGAAGVAAAVLLGGSVAMSGAAAAVTGDPLAPYKTVGHAVGTVSGAVGSAVGQALSFGEDDLPEQAAPIAHLNKRLSGARAALAHGDTTQVQALVDELTAVLATADLTDEQRAALQHRLDGLEDALAKGAPTPQDGTAKGGGAKAPADKAPADKAPADKGGVDKAPEDKAPEDKAPADKAPEDKATEDEVSDTSGEPTSDETQQQVPTPQPQPRATGGPGGGGRGGASQQSTELDADPTEPRSQGVSRR